MSVTSFLMNRRPLQWILKRKSKETIRGYYLADDWNKKKKKLEKQFNTNNKKLINLCWMVWNSNSFPFFFFFLSRGVGFFSRVLCLFLTGRLKTHRKQKRKEIEYFRRKKFNTHGHTAGQSQQTGPHLGVMSGVWYFLVFFFLLGMCRDYYYPQSLLFSLIFFPSSSFPAWFLISDR